MTRLECELEAEVARLEKLVYVPGLWKCAKCALSLISKTLYVNLGVVGANTSPQQCANGCGPMWRVTERDAGNEVCDRLEALTIKQREDAADAARYRKLKPRLLHIDPNFFGDRPNRALALVFSAPQGVDWVTGLDTALDAITWEPGDDTSQARLDQQTAEWRAGIAAP